MEPKKMTVKQLKDELTARGLDVKGLKAALQARLEEALSAEVAHTTSQQCTAGETGLSSTAQDSSAADAPTADAPAEKAPPAEVPAEAPGGIAESTSEEPGAVSIAPEAMSVEEGEAVAAATAVAADEESGTKRKADTFDEGEDEPAFTPSKDPSVNTGVAEPAAEPGIESDAKRARIDGAAPTVDASAEDTAVATQSVETAADSNPVAPPPVEATKGAGEGGGARDSSFLPGMGGHAGTNVAHTDFREGDWVCPRDECRNHNFASRLVCRRCPQVRPGVDPEQARMQQQQQQYGGGGGYGGGGPPGRHHQNMRPGDWICPDPSCANLNFASRSVCRMCPIPRPAGVGPPGMHGGGGGGGGGFPRDMRPGDWICPNKECNNHNFASRIVCRMCNAPKPEGAGMQGGGHGGPGGMPPPPRHGGGPPGGYGGGGGGYGGPPPPHHGGGGYGGGYDNRGGGGYHPPPPGGYGGPPQGGGYGGPPGGGYNSYAGGYGSY